MVGLTKSLAVMYRDKGVRTNAIAPGGTVTGIQVDVDVDAEAQGPSVLMGHLGNIGRTATADEQAAAIVFLASGAAGNINGAVLSSSPWAAAGPPFETRGPASRRFGVSRGG
ncbi:SDR family oxidoreductase [Streptomyces sp. NPDC087844]|uniref:SDR family oxidoreductase n=1 Tax=Streptomyces sp. NPDC087844 TaxID=3365805 RepID=UPI00380AF65A